MSEVVKIAEVVTAQLTEYNAEMQFAPEFELNDLREMKVVVVPLGTEYKLLSRVSHEELHKISIGVLKRADEKDLPDLLRFVEQLGVSFLNKKVGTATCIGVAFNPIYSAEHLRTRRQFTSVIQLTCKLIR